jgi:hypothetical protein
MHRFRKGRSRADAAAPRSPIYLSPADTYENVDLNRGSCNDTAGRPRVPRTEIVKGRTGIFLIFGQSNGANSGDTPYRPRRRVLNFNLFDGACYVAEDPLLGCTDRRGNFAGRLADMLIERGLFDTIVLAPISVGGSAAAEWTTGGVRHRRLQVAIARAQELGLAFTHLLWHQGETDAGAGTERATYRAFLLDIHAALRRYGLTAPLFVAQASICRSPPNGAIRGAQRDVVSPARGIFAGPDTDTIGVEHRFDGCHMRESGLVRHAELWAEVLSAPSPAS